MHNAIRTTRVGRARNPWLGLLVLGFAATVAQAQDSGESNACGPLSGIHYGPYDYRTEKGRLRIVDTAHFTPVVEALVSGATGDLNKDIDYTLHAAPNHHRALVSLMRLAARSKAVQLRGFQWPFACYFDRAVRFAPDDVIVRMLYAQFLGQNKRVEDAVRQLNFAIKLAPENAITQYNVGLVFMELGQHDRALEQAHLALKMGYTRAELTDSLKKVNRWKEPE